MLDYLLWGLFFIVGALQQKRRMKNLQLKITVSADINRRESAKQHIYD